RRFARAHHDHQVARTGVDHVGGHLNPAHRFQFFVEGLNGEEFNALEVLVFESADGGTEDAAEEHILVVGGWRLAVSNARLASRQWPAASGYWICATTRV